MPRPRDHHPDVEFEVDLDVQSRCVGCNETREVPPGTPMTVRDKDSLTYIVVLTTHCQRCREKRVRVKVGIGM
jgi:hypothetical protein